jgi:hypothetical protein
MLLVMMSKVARSANTFCWISGVPRQKSGEHQSKKQKVAEDDEEDDETFCGICGGPYSQSEFWIGCDICEKW